MIALFLVLIELLIPIENPNDYVEYELSVEGKSHLYWPFYSPEIYSAGSWENQYSRWENQLVGQSANDQLTETTWRFDNDHLFLNNEPTHHLYADWFAQDWNYKDGGNSDCGMQFFSPLAGQIIRMDTQCTSQSADCENPFCDRTSPFIYGNQIYILSSADGINFVFRASHFKSISENLAVNDYLIPRQLIGEIGNEGNSSYAHVHASLWKNVSTEDVENIRNGLIDMPVEEGIYEGGIPADFHFDAILNPLSSRNENIGLFPNPVNQYLNVDLGLVRKDVVLEIVDISGRLRLTSKQLSGRTTLDVNFLEPGVYYIRIKSKRSNTVRSVKIIKN
jgi:hypothetical protein